MTTIVKAVCKQCSKPFAYKRVGGIRQYCNHQCLVAFNVSRRLTKPTSFLCRVCDNPIQQGTRGRIKLYCNKACKMQHRVYAKAKSQTRKLIDQLAYQQLLIETLEQQQKEKHNESQI